jgi:hypothetical protein
MSRVFDLCSGEVGMVPSSAVFHTNIGRYDVEEEENLDGLDTSNNRESVAYQGRTHEHIVEAKSLNHLNPNEGPQSIGESSRCQKGDVHSQELGATVGNCHIAVLGGLENGKPQDREGSTRGIPIHSYGSLWGGLTADASQ